MSNGRIHGAFGMAGGEAGQVGINTVVRVNCSVEELGHIGQAEMLPGDVFEICTPGGMGSPSHLMENRPIALVKYG